jgi:hypothetical protein
MGLQLQILYLIGSKLMIGLSGTFVSRIQSHLRITFSDISMESSEFSNNVS